MLYEISTRSFFVIWSQLNLFNEVNYVTEWEFNEFIH